MDEPRHERAGQILYIEDNPVNVLLVEELVKSVAGLAIASAADRRAPASRGPRTLRPDLILIDMQLPDFDGFEVLRRLRADPRTARDPLHRPVGQRDARGHRRGLAAGFADYWTKPIDFKASSSPR